MRFQWNFHTRDHFTAGTGYITFDRTRAEMELIGDSGFDFGSIFSETKHFFNEPQD